MLSCLFRNKHTNNLYFIITYEWYLYRLRKERFGFIMKIKHTSSYRMGRSTIFQFTLESPIRHRVASKQSRHGAERGHRQTVAFVRKSRRGARGVGGKHAAPSPGSRSLVVQTAGGHFDKQRGRTCPPVSRPENPIFPFTDLTLTIRSYPTADSK